MKISYLNPTHSDLSFEKELLRGTNIELVETVVNNADEVHRVTKDAEAILTAVGPIDAAVVANLQKCRVIVRLGVGYEIVDVVSCKQKGIHVCNVPDYGTEEVANHAVALLFAVHRRILSYDRTVRNRQWGHALPWPIHRLSTLRVGVVGLGRIGANLRSLHQTVCSGCCRVRSVSRCGAIGGKKRYAHVARVTFRDERHHQSVSTSFGKDPSSCFYPDDRIDEEETHHHQCQPGRIN